MNTYNVFNCQFTAVQLSLGRKCCLSGREALAEVMDRDFQEVKWNFLSDHKLNAHYHHEYENTKQKDVFIMRVANKRVYRKAKDYIEDNTQIRFPYLYVILDCRQETPTIMIEDNSEVPSSLKEVVAVITFSLNLAMKSKGWKVKLMRQEGELSPIPFSLRPVMEPLLDKPRTIEEFHGVDNIWELYKKKKKVPDFRDAIAIKYRAQGEDLIARLHKMIDGCTTPMDAIMPIRAAIEASVIRRPTWSEFHKEFPSVCCARSTYERLTNPDNCTYNHLKTYHDLVTFFTKL